MPFICKSYGINEFEVQDPRLKLKMYLDSVCKCKEYIEIFCSRSKILNIDITNSKLKMYLDGVCKFFECKLINSKF